MSYIDPTLEGQEWLDSCRDYNLIKARETGRHREPAMHQKGALEALKKWFDSPPAEPGGIVVLPTGGGKTFTAVRFLCKEPLSKGYKVLWLAHTHHLLDQALNAFGPMDPAAIAANGCEAGTIAEPKERLKVRVVSGTPGHCKVSSIEPTDDVLIITLQTITNAWRNEHWALEAFLSAAGENLVVVFDEAHHSPASSYRKLLHDLRAAHPKMFLLGLTATPTYTDEAKRGWLGKLFSQGILYQVSAQKLMAEKILARPVIERITTDVVPDFSDREYTKWLGTYSDLPETIISDLAVNKHRNELIADAYLKNRDRFGKTIIFAERWYQCDAIREMLLKRGVRADVVYSHIDGRLGTVDERNNRTKDENAKVLDAFRRNELDVLINVRMLTEGTDVPNVNSVFLTRQTTSQILLTQMVGRALRGPKFGGTEDANIVTFVDNWRQAISFAEYTELPSGGMVESDGKGQRLPLNLVSIELVRQLARQMDSGRNVNAVDFLTMLPHGWYRVEFEAPRSEDGGQEEGFIREMVLVFQDDVDAYARLIDELCKQDLAAYSVASSFAACEPQLTSWCAAFFGDSVAPCSPERLKNIFDIARHIADSDGEPPQFFRFEERDSHDLDKIARHHIDIDLGQRSILESLATEYQRTDRYWRTMYSSFDLFKSHYDGCSNRILMSTSSPAPLQGARGIVAAAGVPTLEPSDALKQQVKARDGNRCLCCGETTARLLEIDHVAPAYYGGSNSIENLQTLCRECNSQKGINTINFRINHNDTLTAASPVFVQPAIPTGTLVQDAEAWRQSIRRCLNMFYKCNAVKEVHIGKKGDGYYAWEVELYHGNDPVWVEPYLLETLQRIYKARKHLRTPSPTGIWVYAPDASTLYTNIRKRKVDVERPSSRARRSSGEFLGDLSKVLDKINPFE